MAALRNGLQSLSSFRNSTAVSSSSSFSPSVLFACKYEFSGRNNTNCNHAPLSMRIPRSFPEMRSSLSIKNLMSCKGYRMTSHKESYSQKFSEEYRFRLIRSGIALANQRGLIWGERGLETFSGQKTSVTTANDTISLSLESNCGQIPGILEQESEDASADGSLPHVNCQSAHNNDHSAIQHSGPAHAIAEVDIRVMAELEDALGFPLGQGPQSPSPKPLVIVVSGPSGVGKDAVIKKLQKTRTDIHFVVTATTRPMRPNEVDGVDYHFMSKSEFQEMIENHELLEHAIVYGDYKGIPKQQVREFMNQGKDVVLRVDVQGAATVRSILGSEAVFIFLAAESEVSLVKRLIERKTETMDKMLVRVATAREELNRMEEFDYVVVNQEGCLDRTVSLICSIIDAEKARVKPKIAEI